MRKGTFRVLSFVFVLCIHSQGANGAKVLFPDTDERVSEDSTQAKIPVQVGGDIEDAGNFTVIVTPLTVARYNAHPDIYGTICDSVIAEGINTAEEEDFNTDPVEMQVLDSDIPTHTESSVYEFTMDIAIYDDDIQEPQEYFLVVLDVRDSDPGSQGKLEVDPNKRCLKIRIKEDRSDTFEVMFEPIVTVMSEDAGQVEMLKIVKRGRTEQVVDVTLLCSGTNCDEDFTLSRMVTLQPNESSAMVNITVLDDWYPEDNETFTITGYSNNGALALSNILMFTITILDNDYAVIGFVPREVTVKEGETVLLTTTLNNNNLTTNDYHRSEFFTVKIQGGNATEMEHYRLIRPSILTESSYVPGDEIEIKTINDTKLERSRQFEVIIEDPSHDPLNVLNPNRVIVTIRDDDGKPNQPSLGATTFTERSITLSWTIQTHELRPIGEYDITVESIRVRSPPPSAPSDRRTTRSSPTRVNRQAAISGQDSRIERHEYTVTKANCKLDLSTGIDHCEHTVDQNVETGRAYNVIMCAGNEFANVCDESGFGIPVIITPTTRGPAGLEGVTDGESGGGLPTTTILWIVIGVLAALLIGCSILACLSLCSAIYALQHRENKEIDEEDTKRRSRVRAAASSDSQSSTEAI